MALELIKYHGSSHRIQISILQLISGTNYTTTNSNYSNTSSYLTTLPIWVYDTINDLLFNDFEEIGPGPALVITNYHNLVSTLKKSDVEILTFVN